MNWYRRQKTAGVTFSPSGSGKMAQPMMLLDICSDLYSFGYRDIDILDGTGVGWNFIEPDGDSDYTGPLGTINIYMPIYRQIQDKKTGEWRKAAIPEIDQLTPKKISDLVNAYNEKQGGELVLKLKDIEQSGSRDVNVARVEVVANETVNREEIPEISLANANANNLLQLLAQHGLPVSPEEYAGSFSALDYIGARQLMTQEAITGYERESYEHQDRDNEGNPVGPHITEFGLSADRLETYLKILDGMAAWIMSKDLPDKSISFA